MRRTVVIVFALATLATANAQKQEKKLLDRLLKPDMALQNSAQNKQFVAGGSTLTKTARTKTFFFTNRSSEKEFRGVRKFEAKQLPAEQSRFARQEANTSTRNQLAKVDKPYATTAYGTSDALENGKLVEVSDYPGNRAFLLRGKSQKSLNAQPPPMTIEQVRELLNKNK